MHLYFPFNTFSTNLQQTISLVRSSFIQMNLQMFVFLTYI